ncbi:MAG: multidrug transporter [Candidatus Auribacter fodinae]|jgi:bifunctional UDP-N-acetylglucosamine pyrophosphorylase/glucosamine-1-phosphate N-acetyltransferase|uniref:Multidrug transporter n=1 Tax=Candidatus Auribacter fodinae TaxID=2093366 RepID=A0A3A4RAX4_9BACT|nr:MAG: multidrug transporter [Candidatus Auribacter fodinae]
MSTEIHDLIKKYSSPMNQNEPIISIILAAGHGKRIKSETSKMLHTIWGKPSISRVSDAARKGLKSPNQIIVVGVKAREVIETIGHIENTAYAYQEQQKGTGHATQEALDIMNDLHNYKAIYIFPGDMGLISAEAIAKIKEDFERSNNDMIIMTGEFKEDPWENYYGRIVRVPEIDFNGNISPNYGEVIKIMEFKDILSLSDDTPFVVNHKDRTYRFSKEELIRIKEFNAGVYGFKTQPLIENILRIQSDNIQGEFYLTDLVAILNQSGYKVGISPAVDNEAILGFNIKSVLKAMEAIARNRVYDKLKDIITIEEKEAFFIHDDVVERILEMDKNGEAVDIYIGSGVYLGKNTHLKKGVRIDKNTHIDGAVYINEYTHIGTACSVDNYPDQTITIGKHCELLTGTVIRGQVSIGNNVRIESGVRVTGSSDYPATIERDVLIKGTSYIFGSYIEQEVEIEHSVLKQKRVERIVKKDGSIQPIRYFLPLPEGLDSLSDL